MEAIAVARVRVLVAFAAIEPNASCFLNSLELGPKRPFVTMPRKDKRVETSDLAQMLNNDMMERDYSSRPPLLSA